MIYNFIFSFFLLITYCLKLIIFFTRPISPLLNRTLIPWWWLGEFVSTSLTIPSVNLPDRWSFFNTIKTRMPDLISARFVPFNLIAQVICRSFLIWNNSLHFIFCLSLIAIFRLRTRKSFIKLEFHLKHFLVVRYINFKIYIHVDVR